MNTKSTDRNQFVQWKAMALAAVAVASLASTSALARDDNDEFKFDLVSSSPTILPHAQGRVRIESVGPVEIMNVTVWGLPPNTDFDFFVIQVPRAPFGLSWYQGLRRESQTDQAYFLPARGSPLQIQIENVASEELYASWCGAFDRTIRAS
jgi:hypothetical protein